MGVSAEQDDKEEVAMKNEEEQKPAASHTGVQQQEEGLTTSQTNGTISTKETHLPHRAGLANPACSNLCCPNALTQDLRAHTSVVQGLSQLPANSIDFVAEQQRGVFRGMAAAEAAYKPGDDR
jgi:hypothetical protein